MADTLPSTTLPPSGGHAMLHIHIGHHFFGGGNIGDDWMLAGFLHALDASGLRARLTCCILGDRAAMALRFPQVEWLEYEGSLRRRLIFEADIWLGLGGTPFQLDSGTWLLDHLLEEMSYCRSGRTAVYFLGVGVESPEVMRAPQVARIVNHAAHIWTRDQPSADLLSTVARRLTVISTGADLAHIYFGTLPASDAKEPKRDLGMVLHVEKASQLDTAEVSAFIQGFKGHPPRWIAQEYRHLPVSELSILENLDPQARVALTPVIPDYHQGSLDSFLRCYEGLGTLFSSRYHSALASAWLGSAIAVFARNGKLGNLIEQLDAHRCHSLTSREEITRAVANASPVPRPTLARLCGQAHEACAEFFVQAAGFIRKAGGQTVTLRPSDEAPSDFAAVEMDYVARGRALAALRNEGDMLRSQIAAWEKNFHALEQDRAARGAVIEEQGQRIAALEKMIWLTEKDRNYWKNQVEKLGQRTMDLEKLVWLTEQDRDSWKHAASKPATLSA